VEILLGALSRDLRVQAVMKLELHPRDPSMFKYNELRKHVLDKSVTAETLAFVDTEEALTEPGVSPYPIQAGVLHLHMAVGVNLRAVTNEDSLAPAHVSEELSTAIAETAIDMKMTNMMKAFCASTFKLSKGNEPRSGGNQTARAYAIQVVIHLHTY
jgi:hypothetical protein